MKIKCTVCGKEFEYDIESAVKIEAKAAAEKETQAALETFKEKLVAAQQEKAKLEHDKSRLEREAEARGKELGRLEFEKEYAERTKETEKMRAERDAKKTRELSDALKQIDELKTAREELAIASQKSLSEEKDKLRKEALEYKEQLAKDLREQGLREKDKEIDALKYQIKLQIDEVNRLKEKTNISQQIQGKVYEMNVESYLNAVCKEHALLDEIQSTKNRGDICQTVFDARKNECGKIIWEVKDTERWQNKWLETLTRDMEEREAALGVIVVRDTLDGYDGKWYAGNRIFVTKIDSVKPLALIFRQQIVKMRDLQKSHEFPAKKLEVAYKYIFGGKFAENLGLIISGYDRDKTLLEKERDAAKKNWAEREIRIEASKDAALALLGGINEIRAIGDLDLPQLSHGTADTDADESLKQKSL